MKISRQLTIDWARIVEQDKALGTYYYGHCPTCFTNTTAHADAFKRAIVCDECGERMTIETLENRNLNEPAAIAAKEKV